MLISSREIQQSFVNRTKTSVAELIRSAATGTRPGDFTYVDPDTGNRIFEPIYQKIRSSEIIRLKVWDATGRIIYSDDGSIIGQQFLDNTETFTALAGEVVSELGEVVKAEQVSEQGNRQILEVYVPIGFGNQPPIGVIEAYFKLDNVNTQIGETQWIIGISIGIFSLATFILLVVFFRTQIYQPISLLKTAAQAVERGDLRQRVKLDSKDEMGMLASAFNSMTSRLQESYAGLENKVQERTRKLSESEFRYRRLFEAAQDGIILLDAETGETTDINPFFEKLFQVDRNEILGKTLWEIKFFGDGDWARTAFRELLTKGVVAYPELALRQDHNPLWVEFVGKAYNAGDREFIQCNIRDITERKKTDEKRKELDELKSNFIKIVSHQLRTPLGVVRWNIEELLSGSEGQLPEGQQQLLRTVYRANKDVIERINDMLTALDIEENRIKLELSSTQFESLVSSVVEELKPMAGLKQVGIEVSLPPATEALPAINMDPVRIRDAVYKLLDNAITYTQEAGKVRLKLMKHNDFARLEVSDNGIGIPKTERDRLFSRFQRASNAFNLKPDASGLGLFIAKHFIEDHNGRIDFESEEGKGSTFWFELPLV